MILKRPIHSVHYSPNSKYIVLTRFPQITFIGGRVGIRKDTLQIWDVESGKLVAKRNQNRNASAFKAAFTQDGRHILAISLDGDVSMIEVATMNIPKLFAFQLYALLAYLPFLLTSSF